MCQLAMYDQSGRRYKVSLKNLARTAEIQEWRENNTRENHENYSG